MPINRIRYFIVFLISCALTAWVRVPATHHGHPLSWGPAQWVTVDAVARWAAGQLFDIALKSLVILVVYALAANYCRQSIAASTAILALLWQAREDSVASPAVAVCLLSLCAVAALLPTYISWVSRQKLAAAGCLSALCFLYCYPAGGALLAVQVLVLGSVAVWHIGSPRVPFWLEKSAPVVAAFVVVSAPCAWFYRVLAPRFSVSPAADLVTLGAENGLDKMIAFLVVAIAVLGLLIAWTRSSQIAGPDAEEREMRRGRGFLVALSLLALAMLGPGQIYLPGMASLLVLALLVDRNSALRGLSRDSLRPSKT